jgi:hypothetical protein
VEFEDILVALFPHTFNFVCPSIRKALGTHFFGSSPSTSTVFSGMIHTAVLRYVCIIQEGIILVVDINHQLHTTIVPFSEAKAHSLIIVYHTTIQHLLVFTYRIGTKLIIDYIEYKMGKKGGEFQSRKKGGKGGGGVGGGGGGGNKGGTRQRGYQKKGYHDNYELATREDMLCKEVSVTDAEQNPLSGLSLRMWDFSQCDPKRCTGARLARRGIFKSMPLKQPFRGLVLSPNGSESVSPADAGILEEYGLSVIDCSWARLAEIPFKQMVSSYSF